MHTQQRKGRHQGPGGQSCGVVLATSLLNAYLTAGSVGGLSSKLRYQAQVGSTAVPSASAVVAGHHFS